MVAMAEMSSFQLWREADQERATTGEFSEGATTVDVRILCQYCSLHCWTVFVYLLRRTAEEEALVSTRSSSKLLALSARTKWYSRKWAWLQ